MKKSRYKECIRTISRGDKYGLRPDTKNPLAPFDSEYIAAKQLIKSMEVGTFNANKRTTNAGGWRNKKQRAFTL